MKYLGCFAWVISTNDVPRPSTPPAIYPRPLTNYVNPPRRWGQLKSQPRRISRAKLRRLTYQVIQARRGQSGLIERIGYVAYTVQRLGEHPTAIMNEKDHPSDNQGVCSRVKQQALNSWGVTSILGKRMSAAFSDSSISKLQHSLYSIMLWN